MSTDREHYSYRAYSTVEEARRFDASRFGGPIGAQIKRRQEEIVFSTLPDVAGRRVVDVGAGTGRLTLPFLERGARVDACDVSPAMLDVLREKTKDAKLRVHLTDAHQLPFADREFECAVCFRVLLHVVDWKRALAELCRVSDDWLLLDLPPRHGLQWLVPIRHRVRALFVRQVQAYRTFRVRDVIDELGRHGFEVVSADPGFFLPLFVYRWIGSARLMRGAERLFAALRLTRHFGSPLTLFARRRN